MGELHSEQPVGESFEVDLREPVRRRANSTLRDMTKSGVSAEIDLGEHGVHEVPDVRLRESSKAGHLTAYIREKTGEHKVITATVAVGIVLAGIYGIRHSRKK